tara:strand:- start:53277 stop:53795 length:519 start_codon:yes stop_codon:yes gene_type:complete
MKKIKLILLTLCCISLLTCERDDLCPETTPTTPSLVIGFFNNALPENPKTVIDLYVIGLDNDNVLPGYSVVDVDELILPLRTDTDTTTFFLTNNTVLDDDGNITSGNTDTVTITYDRKDIYVSRACGYKTIYENVDVTIDGGTDGNWIILAQPENDNLTIEDETTTHYYFNH